MPLFVRYFLAIIVAAIIITFVTFIFWNGVGDVKNNSQDKTKPFVEKNPNIIITRDSGTSWTGLSGSSKLALITLEFDRRDPDLLYVGTKGSGLWLYSDNKKTLEQVKDPGDILKLNSDVYVVTQDKKSSVLYLSVQQDKFARVIKLTENTANEIYRSPLQNYGIFGIAVELDDANRIHVAEGDGTFLESSDGGESKSWAPISRTREGIIKLIQDPNVSGKYWGLGNKFELYKTELGGLVWKALPQISVQNKRVKKVNDMVYNYGRKTLVAGTDYGLIESSDEGNSWAAIITPIPPDTLEITAIAAHPKFGEVMWMAAGNQLFRTDDGGITWTRIEVNTNRAITFIRVHPNNSKIIYVGLAK